MTTKKPRCKLLGTDGNVFALAGRVSQALKKSGFHDKSKEFMDRLVKCESYDESLQLMMKYVDVY